MAGPPAADHRRRRASSATTSCSRRCTGTARAARAPDRRHGLRQLHARRAGLAGGAARRPPPRRSSRHDMTAPLPADMGRLRLRDPRRGHRLADLLPAQPDRDHGRQHQRPAQPARLRRRRARRAGGRSRASCSTRAARSTATRCRAPSRRPRPTGATSPAPARAPATTSRSASARRSASTSRASTALPVTIARPFNNYGPGLKITDGRVLPDFARDVLAGRDIVMLSDGSPTRTFCYARTRSPATTRCWCAAAPASRTTSASRGRRSRWRELAERDRRAGARAVRLPRQGRAAAERRGRLPGGQPEPPLPGHRQGARASSATTRRAGSTRASAAPWSGTRTTATAEAA